MEHILFLGNPGVGKSSLLNWLIGIPKFRAGPNIGTGLTNVLHTVRHNDRLYSDTPGLDDIEKVELAAHHISHVLSKGGRFKLVFVCTLEEGRTRSTEVATIDAVLTAIENAGFDTTDKYSLLINKVNPQVMQLLNIERNLEILRFQFSRRNRVLRHMAFSPIVEGAMGANDFMMEDRSFLSQFIRDVRTLEISPNSKVNVQEEDFENMKTKYEKELKDLRHKVEELEKERRDSVVFALLSSAVQGFFTGAGGELVGQILKGTMVAKSAATASKSDIFPTFMQKVASYFRFTESTIEYSAFSKSWMGGAGS